MTGKKGGQANRVFSVELVSADDVHKVNMPNGSHSLLLEGTIGALRRAEFIEDSVLELAGTNGTLRVDLSTGDLAKRIAKPSGRESP